MVEQMSFLYAFAAIGAFWLGAPLGSIVGNVFFLVVMAALTGMKMTDFIDWSWWWVALPVWGFAGATFGKLWYARISA
jgi:hypothetical protein